MATDDVSPLPDIAHLHDRHHGLTAAVARYYAEAAAVCLQRHHASPKIVHVADDNIAAQFYLIAWSAPSDRQVAAWANRDEATRDAAYGVVIAAAEAHLGLFVIGRAPIRSGADYLVGRKPYNDRGDELLDFEDVGVSRLEVSGIDRCGDDSDVAARLRTKVEQLRRASSPHAGIAGVVAFDRARVGFQRA